MRYNRLGNSGLKVSEFCLGTMTFGKTTDEAEARAMVDMAWDTGVNFFDTADSYGDGKSEEILGAALSTRRSDAVVATKFFNATASGINDSGASRHHILKAVEGSLKRLKTDYIDVYYVHHLDIETTTEETLRCLDDLARHGKVRYIACSNYPAWRLCDALWISRTRNLERFICYQAQYSLVVRDIEQELFPLCAEKGLGIVAWSPLAGGFLSGKYRPGTRRAPGSRSEEGWVWPERLFPSTADATVESLLAIAAEIERSPAQVALRWVMQRDPVAAAIAGARTAAQLKDNLGAVGWSLPEEADRRLREVSHLPERFPASLENSMVERRARAVKLPPNR